ncbi:glycosyltransferase family 4 protein [Chthonobacter rhizosphaerae]|uniref:glycosyltransferase family 4 protein n=1 Tax=Chthonobacter rhizosphaerae TaxID=2735553 RepID=UPI0015EF100C|nr:glycosyltransferase family 4 protein [Chthonobacter rhizosphaerae]
MTRPLSITFVLPSFVTFPIGGFRVVYEYADRLAAYGHRVTIVFPRKILPGDRPDSALDPVKELLWPVKTRLRHRPLVPWHSFHPGVKLHLAPRVVDRFIRDADVVVATGWQTAEPVARLSPSKGRKHYLIQHYETWSGPKEAVDATWRLPLKKIVISKWLRELGRELDPGGEVAYIPNGLDFDRFRIIVPPESRPLSVLSLYHNFEFKGVAYALKALARFHERHPDVPVTLFGAEAKGPEVPDWIRYVEGADQEALVKDVYNRHAIYLGASITEGWGLPPAEAMACGCAFVGTDIDGFREFAVHEETALLCPPRDADGLYRNLCRMADDPALLRRIQETGTAHIRTFTWERAARVFEAYVQG